MKILPELPNAICRTEVSEWANQPWRPELVSFLADTVEGEIERGSVFEGTSWAPLGDRVTLSELQELRHEMIGAVDAIEPLDASAEQLQRMSRATDCDSDVAKIFWNHLARIGEGMASSPDCWRWFAVRIVPDLIIRRWANENGRVTAERFLNTTKVRCWPQHLWWYAWVCCDATGEINPELFSFMKSADARSSMLERTGGGYSRSILQAVITQIIQVGASGESEHSTEFLLRGMMVRLSWLSGARNISALDEQGRQELTGELCSWAEEHYTGKR
jgi:hypothetical protein